MARIGPAAGFLNVKGMIEALNDMIFILDPADGLKPFRFDLQLFAAEDEGRTEEPTEKKLREAREKGQVAKTTELPQAIVVIFGVLVIFMLGAWIYDSMARLMNFYMAGFSRFTLTERSILIEFYCGQVIEQVVSRSLNRL